MFFIDVFLSEGVYMDKKDAVLTESPKIRNCFDQILNNCRSKSEVFFARIQTKTTKVPQTYLSQNVPLNE